jgi:hypothetical protein
MKQIILILSNHVKSTFWAGVGVECFRAGSGLYSAELGFLLAWVLML